MSLLDTYRQKLAAQIQEHKAQLDLLKAKAKRFAAESKVVGHAELVVADRQLDQVKTKLKELKGASGVAYQEIKSGVKKALADLQVSTKKAARHFNAQAAPPKPRAQKRTAKPKTARRKTSKAK